MLDSIRQQLTVPSFRTRCKDKLTRAPKQPFNRLMRLAALGRTAPDDGNVVAHFAATGAMRPHAVIGDRPLAGSLLADELRPRDGIHIG